MPYRPLAATRAPKSIRDFVAKHIDMQFADVHAMLRLPVVSKNFVQPICARNYAAR